MAKASLKNQVETIPDTITKTEIIILALTTGYIAAGCNLKIAMNKAAEDFKTAKDRLQEIVSREI